MSRVNLDTTLGAASIGLCVSCIVFGILTTQVFLYYRRYPADRRFYKVLVGIIWVLELVDQIFIIHFAYYYTVSHFGDLKTLFEGDVIWSVLTEVALAAIVGILVKACYAMRVWRFSNRNILVTGVISFLILAQVGFATAYVVKSFMWNKFSLTPKLRIYAAFSLASGVLTDIITAGALSFFLRRMRTGFKTSDSLVNKLTVYAINTGALTGAISLTTLLLYNLRPNDFYFMAFYFVLAKFYAISLLCTLNTRKSIRGKALTRKRRPVKSSTAVEIPSIWWMSIPRVRVQWFAPIRNRKSNSRVLKLELFMWKPNRKVEAEGSHLDIPRILQVQVHGCVDLALL